MSIQKEKSYKSQWIIFRHPYVSYKSQPWVTHEFLGCGLISYVIAGIHLICAGRNTKQNQNLLGNYFASKNKFLWKLRFLSSVLSHPLMESWGPDLTPQLTPKSLHRLQRLWSTLFSKKMDPKFYGQSNKSLFSHKRQVHAITKITARCQNSSFFKYEFVFKYWI